MVLWQRRAIISPYITHKAAVVLCSVYLGRILTEDYTMEPNTVSKRLLNRLPVYLNHLRSLPEHSENISATALAKALGLGEVMVRKDLARVSHTGRRRTGRNRDRLIADIEQCMNQAMDPEGN